MENNENYFFIKIVSKISSSLPLDEAELQYLLEMFPEDPCFQNSISLMKYFLSQLNIDPQNVEEEVQTLPNPRSENASLYIKTKDDLKTTDSKLITIFSSENNEKVIAGIDAEILEKIATKFFNLPSKQNGFSIKYNNKDRFYNKDLTDMMIKLIVHILQNRNEKIKYFELLNFQDGNWNDLIKIFGNKEKTFENLNNIVLLNCKGINKDSLFEAVNTPNKVGQNRFPNVEIKYK
jgi:hypothetical protein